MKMTISHFSFRKSAFFCSFLATALFPATAFSAYDSSSDTAANVLDYIENERRSERENRLTEAQTELLQDTKAMRKELRQPINEHKAPLPTAFEGDELFYDQKTGEFFARGHVKITEIDNHRVLAENIYGNAYTHDVTVEEAAHILQVTPDMTRVDIRGSKLSYNYAAGVGRIEDAAGKVNHQYIWGKRIEIYPDHVIIHEGRATKCAAKIPDYSVSAARIEIFPGKQAVFYDCDFWIKNIHIAHRDTYTADLRPGHEDAPPFPSVSYTKADGIIVSQDFTLPLAKQIDFVPTLQVTSKSGWKSQAELRIGGDYGTLRLQYGYWQDDDDHWLLRTPSLRYDFGYHFKNMPLGLGIEAERGRWCSGDIKSTHTHWKINLYHEPIFLGVGTSLALATDYSVTTESYDRSRIAGFSWSATVLKKFNDRFSIYGKYSYAQNYVGNTLFDYDVSKYNRALYTGASYRLTERDRFVVGAAYDIDRRTLNDVDYYWYHDMHCVQLVTRYRMKRDSFSLRLNFTPW